MNRKAEPIANPRRSCFDKLSTNGLSGKQDFWAGFLLLLFNYLMSFASCQITLVQLLKKYP
jgi:hypothetical protein